MSDKLLVYRYVASRTLSRVIGVVRLVVMLAVLGHGAVAALFAAATVVCAVVSNVADSICNVVLLPQAAFFRSKGNVELSLSLTVGVSALLVAVVEMYADPLGRFVAGEYMLNGGVLALRILGMGALLQTCTAACRSLLLAHEDVVPAAILSLPMNIIMSVGILTEGRTIGVVALAGLYFFGAAVEAGCALWLSFRRWFPFDCCALLQVARGAVITGFRVPMLAALGSAATFAGYVLVERACAARLTGGMPALLGYALSVGAVIASVVCEVSTAASRRIMLSEAGVTRWVFAVGCIAFASVVAASGGVIWMRGAIMYVLASWGVRSLSMFEGLSLIAIWGALPAAMLSVCVKYLIGKKQSEFVVLASAVGFGAAMLWDVLTYRKWGGWGLATGAVLGPALALLVVGMRTVQLVKSRESVGVAVGR